jgi:hypothetical protein
MTSNRRKAVSRTLLVAGLLAGSTSTMPAFAQDAAAHAPVDGEKILQLLVAKGVISQADADGIVAQAAATPAPSQPAVVAGGVSGDTQTIPYIPQTVRDQIKTQVETEMAAKAENEGWAKPGEVAEWTKRIKLYGDIRVRGEGDFFDKNNDPSIANFNAINTGSPYDINPNTNKLSTPDLNTTHNRERPRIRARLGLDATLTDGITAQVRVATGNDTSPVSTNQTLGGGNGDFSKYSIWLDRANIQFAPKSGPLAGTKLVAGRAENPFWTTELLFDADLNFDGVSLATKTDLDDRLSVFGTMGAFPTYNTDFNFGSRGLGTTVAGGSFKSHDRWLLASQFGGAYALSDTAKLTAAVGYFDFTGAQGQFSSPCQFNQDVCDTDNTRPLFQQYGNSVSPIRNIIPDTTVAPNLSPEPQYFGLVSKFRVLDLHGQLDLTGLGVPVRVEGDFIRNLAFDKARVKALQTNVVGPYNPSGIGWYANLTVGTPNPGKWGEWNISGGYRRIGTDSTVDGFTDSDFHLGGTNAKGYIIGGAFGIGGGTSLGVRWLSSDEITGQPYAVDVLQVDLNAKF